MGLRQRLREVFRRSATGGIIARGPRYGEPYEALLSSTEPALCIAAVYRCVKLLSESVAQLPLRALSRRGRIRVPVDDEALVHLLEVEPDCGFNAFDFWTRVVYDLLMEGNAYIVPQYTRSLELFRLAYVSPRSVAHDTIADTFAITDTAAGINQTLTEREVIHLRGMGHDPKHGMSVLGYARRTLDIAGYGEVETAQRLRTGGGVSGFLTNLNTGLQGLGKHTADQLKAVTENVNDQLRQDRRRLFYLPGSVAYNQVALNSQDLQLLESRRFTVRDICRFFGVHPSFVFDDTSNNYKSAEMANVAFYSNTLNPLLRKIEVELRRKLPYGGLTYGFDRTAIYACDLESKGRYQAQAVGYGRYTINELRVMENQPPLPGGDVLLVSANLKGIDELGGGASGIKAPETDATKRQ